VARRPYILIVEDDPETRLLYQVALTFEGYEVASAGDGVKALVLMEQRLPDLVVLDLGLPRLDGWGVQQEIAASAVTRQIPIVIVTGLDVESDGLDVACVLRKPVTMQQLVDIVRRCLSSGADVVVH
jgi:DNA-binding response OmpR family regulator